MRKALATMLKPLLVANFSVQAGCWTCQICEAFRRLNNNITGNPNSIDLSL
jgi:hypothetical protein